MPFLNEQSINMAEIFKGKLIQNCQQYSRDWH